MSSSASDPRLPTSDIQFFHIPVLLTEVIHFLDPKAGDVIVDCTLGEGGHAQEILGRTAPDGLLIAFELDAVSADRAKQRLSTYSDRLTVISKNFSTLADEVPKVSNGRPITGILMDLGLSSFEIKEGTHGFSFERDQPLDMRLDRSRTVTAADIVNQWPIDKLIWIFQEYGQEKFSYPIAAHICRVRRQKRFTTTRQLTKAILLAIRTRLKSKSEIPWVGGRHPATRIFQALRIAVNDELGVLEHTLPRAIEQLAPDGRLVVIAFHSLEDRIIKNVFRSQAREGKVSLLSKKPIVPSDLERKQNPSSRSAKLRAIQKI